MPSWWIIRQFLTGSPPVDRLVSCQTLTSVHAQKASLLGILNWGGSPWQALIVYVSFCTMETAAHKQGTSFADYLRPTLLRTLIVAFHGI